MDKSRRLEQELELFQRLTSVIVLEVQSRLHPNGTPSKVVERVNSIGKAWIDEPALIRLANHDALRSRKQRAICVVNSYSSLK